jgi:hypothetical protein
MPRLQKYSIFALSVSLVSAVAVVTLYGLSGRVWVATAGFSILGFLAIGENGTVPASVLAALPWAAAWVLLVVSSTATVVLYGRPGR